MLQLTKRTEYGLIALVHMVDRGRAGRVGADRAGADLVTAREVGERYPVPRRLLAEVLKDLCHAGLIESHRGPTGGYALARAAEDITLAQVIAALEGAPELTSCESATVLKHGGCEVQPVCPIRSPIHRVREGLWQMLERTTLRSLVSTSPIVSTTSPQLYSRPHEPAHALAGTPS